jgi:hypothetical protein
MLSDVRKLKTSQVMLSLVASLICASSAWLAAAAQNSRTGLVTGVINGKTPAAQSSRCKLVDQLFLFRSAPSPLDFSIQSLFIHLSISARFLVEK